MANEGRGMFSSDARRVLVTSPRGGGGEKIFRLCWRGADGMSALGECQENVRRKGCNFACPSRLFVYSSVPASARRVGGFHVLWLVECCMRSFPFESCFNSTAVCRFVGL